MTLGSGRFRYEVATGSEQPWGELPDGWRWGWIAAVACDSRDRVYVHSRSEHPLVVFDREGRFLEAWGEGLLPDAHGIFIDAEDNVYCTQRNDHCVRKFDRHGELLLTLGTPGRRRPGGKGTPFDLPTDVGVASTGDIFVSDGYGNARIHRFSAEGELLLSWGERGDGPGQFATPHCVRVDRHDRVWVCDRENRRVQIFDTNGEFITQWAGLRRPDALCFDPIEPVVYIPQVEQELGIYTLDGELITCWGGGRRSQRPGEFLASPHGVWADSRGDLYVSEVGTDARLQKFVRRGRAPDPSRRDESPDAHRIDAPTAVR